MQGSLRAQGPHERTARLRLPPHAHSCLALLARPSEPPGVDVRSVACGAYQTAAVTRAGELFCWGWQFEDGPSGSIQERKARSKWPPGSGQPTAQCPGRLGLALQARRGALHLRRTARPLSQCGPEPRPKPPILWLSTAQEGYTCVPRRMEGLGALVVRHVSCGNYAAVALTTDGAAFTWGKGARGVLGHGHTRDVASPMRVGALSGTFVWDARLGKAFLLCLSAAGELFSNGAADGGVLGHSTRADESAPLRVAALEGTRVVALDCGDSHAAALTASGEVYCWGRGSHGRLGLGHSRDVPTPTRVEPMVGKRPCSTAHLQPTPRCIRMHSFRSQPRARPQVGKTCVEVSCSSYATACRTDTGHVWRWGGTWDSAVSVAPTAHHPAASRG